jgi:carboxypeptidase Taq
MGNYNKLKKSFASLSHLNYIQRILMWDEAVMMPEGSGFYRAEAVATFNQLMQKSITSKKISLLIEAAKNENLSSPWDAANLAWMERKYISSNCIPSQLTVKSTKAMLAAFQAWRKYREHNNWHDFVPYLKKSFHLVQEIAERRSQVLQLPPYEVLMDGFSPGLTQNKVDKIFSILKDHIPKLRKRIMEKQRNDSIIELTETFPVEKQTELGLFLMHAMNFDFNHGRLDVSHHPFCDGIPVDIRITTRYSEDNFLGSLFGIIHESGHALYEQGMPKEWVFQPVGQTQSKALHESQSLLFEYEVCHSKDFLEFLGKKISQLFGSSPALLENNLYKLITRVKTNLIRIEADEVSYPLHVILRYEIENKLFEGEIDIEDLPSIWNEQMLKYFDMSTEGNYKDGVMQDMHWAWGYFGYFPSYTFGQLMAAQLYSTFSKNNDDFGSQLKVGNFTLLHKWLEKNVYSYASSISNDELLLKVTGESINPDYFIKRVKNRYLSE